MNTFNTNGQQSFNTVGSGQNDASNSLENLESDATSAGVIHAQTAPSEFTQHQKLVKQRRRRTRYIILAGGLVAGLLIVLLTRHLAYKRVLASKQNDATQRYSTLKIPLTDENDNASKLSVQDNGVLSINGQLNVNNSLVISPTNQPTNAVAGQMYYDQTTNQLSYYNGVKFLTVLSGTSGTGNAAVRSIGASSGNIATGDGITVLNNTISNTGVLSVQGESGNVSLVSGGGIAVNGTTLSNTGVLSLAGQHGDISLGLGLSASNGQLSNSGVLSATGGPNITVTNDGNGNITISSAGLPGSGTVASTGGTAGRLAVFDGVQSIADSLISESGTTVSVGGDLSVSGNLNLTTALTVANGGTGASSAGGARTNLGAAASGANSDITSISGLTSALTVSQGGTGVGTLATNGVIIGNGANGLTSVVAGASGLCLISTNGTPSFQTCPGGTTPTSIDGLSGALTISNTSGSGSTITIDNASTVAKGIASFNATNFLVTSGSVNTVQDIAVSATPTFAGLTLTSPLAVASGGTGANSASGARTNLGAAASGSNSDITSIHGLTTALSVLQGGSGATTLTANGVLLGNGSSAVTATTGSNGQCLIEVAGVPTFSTCPGSGGVTSLDSLTGVISLNNSSGSGGAITIDDAGTAQKGLAEFNSSNFSVTSGVVNTIQNITTSASPTFNGLTLSGALTVNNISPTAAATFGVTSQNLTLQGAATTISSTSGANTTQLKFVTPTANVTYQLQTATGGTYDICTTAGNCVGTGGGVTSTGGTLNHLAKFTGSQTIADSLISDNGTTVTVAGNLNVTGTLSLTSALTVANGGTGATSFGSNSVIIGNGSGALSSATTGTAGQCLVSTAGTPAFATCPGSGGVTSVNGQTGVISVANATGSGSVVTINDASTASKGIASFNSTNFSVTTGAVNTIQNINTTAAPTFGQLSLTSSQATNPMLLINNTNVAASGNLLDLQLNGSSKFSVTPGGVVTTAGTINGQTISSSANFTGSVTVGTSLNVNTITPSSALTIGANGQSFLLQGNASSTLTATNGGNTTTVAFQSPTASVTYNFATAAAGTYDICTTAGNCAGVGGGVTTAGGTTNHLAKFTSASGIGDSIITDNGSTVTIAGALSVNTLTPTSALTVGATGQNLTLQGATVSLSATSGGITNKLTFATPTSTNKTITVPDASGTVAVSASGPLSIDSSGNLTCATCLTSGGGGAGGVSSLNTITGAVLLQGISAGSITNAGSTITVNDASSSIKGLASFNATNLTVTSGAVNTIQDIAVTSTPTFGGLSLTSALTVANGGTGATTAGGARTNLGAAGSGANSDITSLSGLTTALSTVQGGTGVTTTPTNGQILIGNGSGYSLNTLTAGAGVTITNSAGGITIAAGGAGTCSTCANTSLNNLASVAINTSLLPGASGGADLGSGSLAFGQLFLSGTSLSPASNNFKITGASTGGTRTITLPDASGTVAVSASGYLNLNATTGNLTFVGPLAVTDGGTGASSASGARTNLGAAASGPNSDITSLTGLTTALSVTQGGSGATTASGARTNFGAAASGANSDITSLSGLTTALTVVQGGTGASSLTANSILLGNGTSAITGIAAGGAGLCLISTAGAPAFSTCPGSGGVASVDGLTGTLTVSNSSGSGSIITLNTATTSTLGIASFNSTNFSVSSGAVNTIQGISTSATPTFAGLSLTTALSPANGGTGATSLATNGVIVGQGASALTSVVAGSAGQCLISTAGAPTFTTCPGSGGVASINSQTGAITIAGASAGSVSTASGTITINDATTAVKGLASFNSSNFTVTSGAVNTVQDINSSATPTFNGLNLTTALSIANGGTGATSASAARTSLGTAASGANSDITSLSGLTTALSVVQGGIGVNTLTANGVLIGNGTSAVSAVTGTTGQCLIATTSAAPSFQTCPGSGGVTTVNSQTGAITIQGTTDEISVGTSGGTLTLSTPQAINTTSNVNFGTINAGTLIKTAGTTRIDASGNLSNIGTINTSGLITAGNGLTVSSGTITLNNLTGGSSTCLTLDASNHVGTSTCAVGSGSSPTLQNVYDNSTTTPKITLSGTGKGLFINDASTTVGGNLFAVQNNAGSTQYLGVTTTGTSVAGTLTSSGLITGNTGLTTSGANASINDSSNFNTSLNGGTSTGTINLGNSVAGAITLQSSANVNLNAATIATNQTAINLLNTTATTVNAFGAATTINLGAATGTATILNPNITLGGTGLTTIKGAGNAGMLVATAGFNAASANSGNLTLRSGSVSGATSTSGDSFLKTGDSTTSGNTGNITIQTGAATSGTSGSVNIDTGTGTTTGSINIGATNASAVNVTPATTFNNTVNVAYSGSGSTTAFNVNNSTGSLFDVDSLNSRVNIGNSTGCTGGISSGRLCVTQSVTASGATNTQNVLNIATSGTAGTNYGQRIALNDTSTAKANANTALVIDNTGTTNTSATTNGIYVNNPSGLGGGNLLQLQTGSSDVFKITNAGVATFTGTMNLNGNTTIGASAGSGTTLTNNGATVNSTLALGNFSGGGSIGTAATTVDLYTAISVAETTSSQSLTLPNPTANTAYGRMLYLSNIGSADFTISGTPINSLGLPLKAGASTTLIWSNSNAGASWQYAGADGSSILNQNSTTQTANFTINGTGAAAIFQAGTLQSSSSLSITAASGNLDIGNGSGTTIRLGNSNNARTIYIGNTLGSNAQTIVMGDNTTSTSTTTVQASNGVLLQANNATAGVTVKAVTDSSLAFQVQNASSVSLFTVNTVSSSIVLGTSTNNMTLTAGTFEPILSGTARHSKAIVLPAEYAGAVLDSQSDTGGTVNCSTNGSGTMTSGFVATGRQNYYNWIATGASQCYDVVVQVPIPSDWAAWNGAPSLFVYNSVGTDSTSVMADVIDSSGTTDTNYSATAYNGVSSGTTFGATTLTGLGGTYTAGGYLTFKIRMTSTSSENVRIGNLTLNYFSKY